MKKYFTWPTAKKLTVIGLTIWLVCVLLVLVCGYILYGKCTGLDASKCSDSLLSSAGGIMHVATNFGDVGLIVLILGLIMMLITRLQRK